VCWLFQVVPCPVPQGHPSPHQEPAGDSRPPTGAGGVGTGKVLTPRRGTGASTLPPAGYWGLHPPPRTSLWMSWGFAPQAIYNLFPNPREAHHLIRLLFGNGPAGTIGHHVALWVVLRDHCTPHWLWLWVVPGVGPLHTYFCTGAPLHMAPGAAWPRQGATWQSLGRHCLGHCLPV